MPRRAKSAVGATIPFFKVWDSHLQEATATIRTGFATSAHPEETQGDFAAVVHPILQSTMTLSIATSGFRHCTQSERAFEVVHTQGPVTSPPESGVQYICTFAWRRSKESGNGAALSRLLYCCCQFSSAETNILINLMRLIDTLMHANMVSVERQVAHSAQTLALQLPGIWWIIPVSYTLIKGSDP